MPSGDPARPDSESTDNAVSQPPPISMLKAMLYAPFRPAWVGQRTANLSLKRAWLIHFVSPLATVAVIYLLVFWANSSVSGWAAFTRLVRATQHEIGRLIGELNHHPIERILAVLGMIALVEGAHLVIGFVAMPWGARDERLRQSFGFAVRQTWIASSRLILAALIIGGPLACIEHEDGLWRKTNPRPIRPAIARPMEPVLPKSEPGYDKAMADYEVAFAEWGAATESYYEALDKWREKRPWLQHNPHAVGVPLGFLTALWFLWALFRSIGATRNVPPIARERRCIECGYDLHTIPMDSRCPECGKPVIESLGPDVHPGTAWEHRRGGDTIHTWWHCAQNAIFSPKTFGQSLKVSCATTAHRRFFAINLCAIGLVGVCAVLVVTYILSEWTDFDREPEMHIIIPLAVGSLTLMGALAVACVGAMLVGMIQSLTNKRNLLPAAMQVSSYLSGFLLCWAVFGATLLLMLMMDQSVMLRPMARAIGIQPNVLVTFLFCMPNFACGAFFLQRLAIGTAATRYANK